jgi:hypothetical protein
MLLVSLLRPDLAAAERAHATFHAKLGRFAQRDVALVQLSIIRVINTPVTEALIGLMASAELVSARNT